MTKTSKKKKTYFVCVSYNSKFYLESATSDPNGPEKSIPKYLKKELDGTGTGFGRRDLFFRFNTKKAAEAVESLIAIAPFPQKWKVTVSEVSSSEDDE